MKMVQQTRLGQLTDDERRIAAAFVAKIREKFEHQLVFIILFGSRARGESEPDSDMDMLVVLTDVDSEIWQAIRHLAVEVWLEHLPGWA